jgi:hypothetical protein
VAVTFLGLAAYSSARTSLEELVPWLPTALCLFVLLTVYFIPKLRQTLNGDYGNQIAMEEGCSPGFYGTPVEPGSVRSQMSIRTRQQSPEVERWLTQDTSHMGCGIGRPASRNSGRQSIRDSDIDLDDTSSVTRIVVQRMVSPSRPGYNINNLPQIASESGFPSQRFATAGPSQSSQPKDHYPRSLSLESVAVEGLSSTSAESERPLLG